MKKLTLDKIRNMTPEALMRLSDEDQKLVEKIIKKSAPKSKKEISKPKKMHYNIVFCTPGKKLPDTFAYLWLACAKAGYKCAHIKPEYSANVYFARTQCLGNNALHEDAHRPLFGDQFTYDRIVWIDEDNTPTFDQIQRLIKQDVDIVAGLYHMKCKDKFPVVEEPNMKYYESHGRFDFLSDADVNAYKHLITKKHEKETDKKAIVDHQGYNIKHFLLPVHYTGMGCMAVKQGVFEKIGYPYFAPVFFTLSNGISDFYSEDASFCVRAEMADYTVYVDLGVGIGHEKSYII